MGEEMGKEERLRKPPVRKSWLIAAGALVVVTLTVGFRSGTGPIASAPRFTAADLSQAAGENWLTNGGSRVNQPVSAPPQNDRPHASPRKGAAPRPLPPPPTRGGRNPEPG